MKAKHLAAILLEYPEMEVLISGGSDHSYDQISYADKLTVAKYGKNPSHVEFFEWSGKENASSKEIPIEAIVLVR